MDRYDFMKEALVFAQKAADAGEVPVGCVIVKDNKIISCGKNTSAENKCATKHAEIIAIDRASEVLQRENLCDCDLYVTLEPCPMCAGAIINSKIRKVVFGAFDLNYGACGSVVNLFQLQNIHKPECYGGIMEDACSNILTDFFKNIRNKK